MEYGLDVINDFPTAAKDFALLPSRCPPEFAEPGGREFLQQWRCEQRTPEPTQFSQGVVGRVGVQHAGSDCRALSTSIPSLAVEWDFQGTTPAPLVTFDEHVLTATVGINFSYLQRYQANISYTSHYALGGSAAQSVNLDRDYVALSASYRF